MKTLYRTLIASAIGVAATAGAFIPLNEWYQKRKEEKHDQSHREDLKRQKEQAAQSHGYAFENMRPEHKFYMLSKLYEKNNSTCEKELLLQEIKSIIADAAENNGWAYEILFKQGWQKKLQLTPEKIRKIGSDEIATSRYFARQKEEKRIDAISIRYDSEVFLIQDQYDQQYVREHPDSLFEHTGVPQYPKVMFNNLSDRRRIRGYQRPLYENEAEERKNSFKRVSDAIENARKECRCELEGRLAEIEQNTGATK